jgi:integrase/recombinase XerD
MKFGELRDWLERYLAVRRAVGFTMRAQEPRLRSFVTFVERREPVGTLRAQLAVDWACDEGKHTPSDQTVRLSIVRRFLVYLRASVPETEVPPLGLIAGGGRPSPYIYTEAEVQRLLDAARNLGPKRALRPHTLATAIGLLASSGLRAGEVIRLQLDDVQLDVEPPRLQVLDSKFHKSRLVPLHASAAQALRAYASQRRRLGYDGRCEQFFVSEQRGAFRYHSFWYAFAGLVRRLGIGGGPRWPRIHDIRHTFAVRRLLAWYREGVDVQMRLPELSVYLGHVRPAETYWYLTAIPELLGSAAERFESFGNARGAS